MPQAHASLLSDILMKYFAENEQGLLAQRALAQVQIPEHKKQVFWNFLGKISEKFFAL